MKTYNVKSYHKKRFWAGILLVQFLLFYLLSKTAAAVNFFEKLFEFQKSFHQGLFSLIPFSAGDLLYILLMAAVLQFAYKMVKQKSRKRSIFKFLIFLNILYFFYQICWGMLYFQNRVRQKLPESPLNTEKIKQLTVRYLEKCKQTRILVTEDDNGAFRITDIQLIKVEILRNQTHLPASINNKKGTGIKSFKPSLFKPMMSYTGILGYYNPFTAEAQYNPSLPATYIPFTLSHESAHQLGYAREQEANFIGFLIGEHSHNIELKYSTEYFVLKSLLNFLVEQEPAFVENILTHFSPGMKRDLLAEKVFLKKHAGLLEVLFGITNDLFLKSNQQDGNITYSYFIDLLVRYQ